MIIPKCSGLFFTKKKKLPVLRIFVKKFYNQIQQMMAKTTKWLLQEEKRLRQLKCEQGNRKQLGWTEISVIINRQFQKNKTPKQCRERYINHAKFPNLEETTNGWTPTDIDLLQKLYIDHGSSWKDISSYFPTKSQNAIKNKFNNSLRRVAKTLNQFQTYPIEFNRKKSLSAQLLISMIDFTNQLNKRIQQLQCTWNQESDLFKFRISVIKLCLRPDQTSEPEVNQLIQKISKINLKLRCFGVFKVKHRKHWKLNDRCFHKFIMHEKIVQEHQVEFVDKYEALPSSIMINQQSSSSGTSQNRYFYHLDELESLSLGEVQQTSKYSSQDCLMSQLNKIIGEQMSYTVFDNFS